MNINHVALTARDTYSSWKQLLVIRAKRYAVLSTGPMMYLYQKKSELLFRLLALVSIVSLGSVPCLLVLIY
jgi:hypothetical protein